LAFFVNAHGYKWLQLTIKKPIKRKMLGTFHINGHDRRQLQQIMNGRFNPLRSRPFIQTFARWSRVLIISSLILFGCQEQPSSSESEIKVSPKSNSGVIVAFGDSLTEGYGLMPDQAYPALLEKRLTEKGYQYKVVNAGVSGETSSGALSRVDWILRLNPDIVVLETGANDGLMGINPTVLEQNLGQIIATLQQNGVTVILAGMKMLLNLGPAYTQDFEAVYARVARQYQVTLIPFFLEGVAARRDMNLADGIHPNAKGYELITELVLPYVVDAIGKL
jgi:acyl-CoA thioesterase-1